ncbi:MAG: MFS transporter [Actinomycetota bacterium]
MEAVPPPDSGADEEPRADGASDRYFTGWPALRKRIWGTDEFLKLWLAQVVTSTGEWVFFLVVAIKAADVGRGTPEGAVALVLLARLGPGFFFGQLAGVLADRWDRRKLMAVCDVARAAVVCAFPFLDHVWQLVLLSLLLEAFTLLWIPAKEALVPNLLPRRHLPTANTLSVLATYGTFPLALLLMLVLGGEGGNDTAIGFWFDAGTFVVSAMLIMSIVVQRRERESAPSIDDDKLDVGGIWTEMRDGWRLIFGDSTLRAVNVGLAVGLIGGGMLIPLGTVYATEVLGADNRGYYGMLAGLGVGLGVGVLVLLQVSERINRPWVFGRAVLVAGAALAAATVTTQLVAVIVLLGVVGAGVGVMYILGFTIIQETTDDEMRGRVFAAFYSLARAGVLVALVAAPALAVFFDRVTELSADGAVGVFGYRLLIPGVRITFWLAALIILGAGWLAIRTLRAGASSRPDLRSVE